MDIKSKTNTLRKVFLNILKYFTFNNTDNNFIRTTNYCGFKLFYSLGTSLISRIGFGRIYEKKLSIQIEREILKKKKPVMLDIGANIGLISLFALKANSQVKIYAFEPGPHQADLLEKTIKYNKLNKQIVLNRIALSKNNGTSTFSTHNSKDVSGDGLVDTGRAGPDKIIKVKTQTLDNWWKKNNKPNIDLIKIDTEGAEYMILQGAEELLDQNKPIIFLEIWPDNMKVYNQTPLNLLHLLANYNYELYDINRSNKLTEHNLNKMIGIEENFIAIYAK